MVLKDYYNFFINVDHSFQSCVCENTMHKATEGKPFWLFADSDSNCLFSCPIFFLLNLSFSTPEIQISVPKLNSGSESVANFPSAQRKKRCHSLLLSVFLVQINCLQKKVSKAKTLHCFAFFYVHYCISESCGF